MLTIRLSRIGKKKKPMYRLIISEKARDPYGRALEILGSYNPFTKDLEVNKERIDYWISKGAKTSITVNNLLIEKDVIKGEKLKAAKPKKKKGEEAPKKSAEKPAEKEKTEEKTTETASKTSEKPVKDEKPEITDENKTKKTEEKEPEKKEEESK